MTFWEREAWWGEDPYDRCDTFAELEVVVQVPLCNGCQNPPDFCECQRDDDFPLWRTHNREGKPVLRLDRREFDR